MLVTGYYEAFQGCWKLLKSLLKSASLTVLTLQDFQQALCCASSPFLLGFPSGISALPEHLQPGTAETVNTGDPPRSFVPAPLFPFRLGKFVHVATCKWDVREQLKWDCAEKHTAAGLSRETWWLVCCSWTRSWICPVRTQYCSTWEWREWHWEKWTGELAGMYWLNYFCRLAFWKEIH